MGSYDRPGGPLIISGAPSASSKALPPHGANGYQSILVDNNKLTFTVYALTDACEYKEDRRVEYVRQATGVFPVRVLPSSRASYEATVAEIRALCKVAVQHISDTIKETIGPKGGLRGIVLRKGVLQARDGQQIVQSLISGDVIQGRIVESVAVMLREVSQSLGDGRKTAALICVATVGSALASIDAGIDDHEVCEGIRTAARAAVRTTESMAVPISSKEQIARLAMSAAAGRRDIGEMIADACETVGKDGIVQIERVIPFGDGRVMEMHKHEGVELRCRPLKGMELSEHAVVDWSDPLFVVTTVIVSHIPLIAFMEGAMRLGKPLVVLCDGLSDIATDVLSENIRKGALQCVALRTEQSSSHWHPIYQDVAVRTGATFIEAHPPSVLAGFTDNDFGSAGRVVFNGSTLTIYDGHADEQQMRKHIDRLRVAAEEADSDYECEHVRLRIAKILESVVTISICGLSGADGDIVHSLAADSLRATTSGIKTGIVLGGGASYYRAGLAIRSGLRCEEGKSYGAIALASGLEAPLTALAASAGVQTDDLMVELAHEGMNWDMLSGDVFYGVDRGPVDAAGIACSVITLASEAAVRIIRTRSWEAGAE